MNYCIIWAGVGPLKKFRNISQENVISTVFLFGKVFKKICIFFKLVPRLILLVKIQLFHNPNARLTLIFVVYTSPTISEQLRGALGRLSAISPRKVTHERVLHRPARGTLRGSQGSGPSCRGCC